MRRAGFAACLLVALAGSARADSAATAKATAAAAEGAKLYAAGDYLHAAHRFDDAWAADPLPAYRYNAAQAYRLGNDCEDAANRYEKFLDIARDAQNLEQVRKYLDDERTCVRDRAAVPVVPAKPPLPPVEPPVRVEVPPPPPPPASSHHATLRWAGIATAAAGVIVTGFGIASAHDVSGDTAQQNACNTMGCTAVNALAIQQAGERDTTRMQIELTIGGAAIAGGIVMYVLGRDPERASITPTAGGAVLSTRFRF